MVQISVFITGGVSLVAVLYVLASRVKRIRYQSKERSFDMTFD